MQCVELPVQVTVPGLLRAVAQLAPSDLDTFIAEATAIQKRNRSEASLLAAVHQHLPEQQLQRLRHLEAKDDGTAKSVMIFALLLRFA